MSVVFYSDAENQPCLNFKARKGKNKGKCVYSAFGVMLIAEHANEGASKLDEYYTPNPYAGWTISIRQGPNSSILIHVFLSKLHIQYDARFENN